MSEVSTGSDGRVPQSGGRADSGHPTRGFISETGFTRSHFREGAGVSAVLISEFSW